MVIYHCRAAIPLLVVSCVLLTSSGIVRGEAIFTDKGAFVKNSVKGEGTLTTPGGTKQTFPAMILEIQKKDSTTEARVSGFAPFRELTAAQKTTINKKVTDTYKNVTVAKDATPAYDCHGLTFKSGSVFINNDQVQKIIDDQGWKPPADGKAKKGDIVVYKKNGAVKHSGVVEEVDANGQVTKVKSKWGPWGEYIHAPNDVPKGQTVFGGIDYGTPEVLSGGKPLKDPPADDDLSDFEFIEQVFLKEDLLLNNPIDIFPTASLELVGDPGGFYDYFLDIPEIGLIVDIGDTLTLYVDGIVDALVQGDAANSLFGGWQVQKFSTDFVAWKATQSAFLTNDLLGFQIESSYSTIGEGFFRETVAGSVGRTKGPVVPEPSTLVLFCIGLALPAFSNLLRRKRTIIAYRDRDDHR